MTEQQITWAARHDWFVRADADGTITVRVLASYRDGRRVHDLIEWHQTFGALRLWAGY